MIRVHLSFGAECWAACSRMLSELSVGRLFKSFFSTQRPTSNIQHPIQKP